MSEKIFKNEVVRKKNEIPKLIKDHLEPPKFWRLVTFEQKKAYFLNYGLIIAGITLLSIPIGYLYYKHLEGKKKSGFGLYISEIIENKNLKTEFQSLNVDALSENKSFSQKFKEYEEKRLKSLKEDQQKRIDKLLETNKK